MPLYQYRIVYSVGSLEFTWIRSGESRARVTELATRALKDAHHGHAKLVAVDRLEADDDRK